MQSPSVSNMIFNILTLKKALITPHYMLSTILLMLTTVKTLHPAYAPSFPMKEFYNISGDSDLFEKLSSSSLCRTDSSSVEGCCKCNEICLKMRTCCADYVWSRTKNPQRHFPNISTYIDKMLEVVGEYKYVECLALFPSPLMAKNFAHEYYMRAECDEDASEEERNLCENMDINKLHSLIPVFADDGILYKNIYCAKCNKVNEFKLKTIQKRCNDHTKDERCVYTLDSESHDEYGELIACFPISASTNKCPPKSKYYDLCRAFIGPVGAYRNYFCAQCVDIIDHSVISCFNIHGLGYLPQDKREHPLKFKSLLTNEYIPPLCERHVLSDLFDGRCSLNCPEGYEVGKDDAKCIKVDFKTTFDRCLYQDKSFDVFLVNKTNAGEIIEILSNSTQIIGGYQVVANESDISVIKLENRIDEKTAKTIVEMMSQNKTVDLGGTGRILVTAKGVDLDILKHLHISKIFPFNDLCLTPFAIEDGDGRLFSNCKAMYKDKLDLYENPTLWFEIRNSSVARRLSFCRRFYQPNPDCLKDSTNESLTNSSSNDSDYFNKKSPFYDSYMNYIKTGSCHDRKDLEAITRTNIRSIEWYISVFGSVISLICFTTIGYIHNFVEPFVLDVNLPTKLVSSLFLFDCLLFFVKSVISGISGTSNDTCIVFGVLSHFTMFLLHNWGVVISADIAQMFPAQFDTERGFIKSRLICFVNSLIAILLEILIDHNNILKANYGSIGACAVEFSYSPLLFYHLPVVVSLMTSFIFLVVQFFRSKQHHSAHKKLEKNRGEEINALHVALKLIFVCGIAETLSMFTLKRKPSDEVTISVQFVVIILQTLLKSCKGVILMVIVRRKIYGVIQSKRRQFVIASSIRINPNMYDNEL